MDVWTREMEAGAVSLLCHPFSSATGRSRAGGLDGRAPAHVLYEHASDLLLAARGLRAMAGDDGTLPAVAATLGCIEATVDALADTLERLRPQTVEHVVPAGGRPPTRATNDAARRVAEQCDEAARTLRIARDMTGGLRERVGPALAELA